ncbi:MAG: MFS transporter [Candidatus Nealsonbacteria bacterium]|nr:MAG: MFS transporter [Candidatus Nealsonbacteria bacterium]
MSKAINKVIKTLIFSDFVLNSAWGFLAPIFAIFIVKNITFGNLAEGAKIAGFATLVYWIVKSILQIPIGRRLDRDHGEKDDFRFMVLGIFLTGLVPFGFMISFLAWHIYVFQILHAVGMAMAVPSWLAIFTRHIDRGKEAYEWSLESTSLGFGAGIAGAIGGFMVALYGFNIIFILVGFFTIVSALLLLLIHEEIVSKNHIFPKLPYSF